MDDPELDDNPFIPRPDLIGYEQRCPICNFVIWAVNADESKADGGLGITFECPVCQKMHILCVDELPDPCYYHLSVPFEDQIRFPGLLHRRPPRPSDSEPDQDPPGNP